MPSSPESEGNGGGAEPVAEATVGTETTVGEELERERQRNAELDDRYKRALADLDNLRKRTPQLVDQRVEAVRTTMLADWLEAVDSIERALRMEPVDGSGQSGVRAVLEQMERILQRQGVTRFGEVGEPFDPERHEAISVRPAGDDQPDRAIVDVARSGYALDGRVLRPAQVVVARGDQPPG
jgi:molecular chaperone GrpE